MALWSISVVAHAAAIAGSLPAAAAACLPSILCVLCAAFTLGRAR